MQKRRFPWQGWSRGGPGEAAPGRARQEGVGGEGDVGITPMLRNLRARWRLRLLLRGLSLSVAVGVGVFLLSAYGLEFFRFSPGAVVAFRVVAWGALLASVGLLLIRPLLRRVTDRQVALYLEEHEPSLEATVLGALEAEGAPGGLLSPGLRARLLERGMERAREVDFGRGIDRGGLWWSSGFLSLVSVAGLLFLFLGPSNVRHGVKALAVPTAEADEVSPYAIWVAPGDTTISKGADQSIVAELEGFTSERVSLFFRPQGEEAYQRFSMLPTDSGRFEFFLLNAETTLEYFVEADGVRSRVHTIEVAELPYVARMTHTYFFPEYTGLPSRVVEEAGGIVALEGTRVEIAVVPTLPTPRGRIVTGEGVVVELSPGPEGVLRGELVLERDGSYRIELARADGALIRASPEFAVDVLSDLPPTVSFSRPGRDVDASPLEEVYLEVKADDDYGIGDIRLVYTVNGGKPDTVLLFKAQEGGQLEAVTAGHTLFLEDKDLRPGDVVAYYALAADNRSGSPSQAMSDIYFVSVRPFRRDFRQAQQAPQEGQQPDSGQRGRQPQQNRSLSALQKEVIAATFNLLRDRGRYSPEEWSQNLVSVALAQGRVREEVALLVERMEARGVTVADPRMREIAEMLPSAVADMVAAESFLREGKPDEALPPEQRALTVLQKAEETYERTVAQARQGQPGADQGGGAPADELADLFEMELDRLQNQYETVQRGERQQANQEVDELLERLRELARRQQQEMERQRRRAEMGQTSAAGSGGSSQRALAEAVEETARKLAELSRRTGDQDLAETARRLQQAAENMRRSAAATGQARGLSEATSALEELEEARRRLERNQEGRTEGSLQEALSRVERLAQTQDDVRRRVGELPEDPALRGEVVRRVQEQKDQMLRETEALERDLVRLQQAVRQESRETAQELGQAVDAIREGRLKEKLAYTKGVVEQRERSFAQEWEEQIARDIEGVRRQLQEALDVYGENRPGQGLSEALDQARDLARGAESMARRLENRRAAQSRESGVEERAEGASGGREGEGGRPNPGAGGGGGPDSLGVRRGEPAGREGQERAGRLRVDTFGGGAPGGGSEGRAADTPSVRAGGGQGDSVAGERRAGGPDGGATRGNPRPFTDEEIRQFTREFAQRLTQARQLQESLRREGRTSSELDEAIRVLEELRRPQTYGSLAQVGALQDQLRDSLRRLEFVLRREVEGEGRGRAALRGAQDLPPEFRRMVEEYFRNLARRGGGS